MQKSIFTTFFPFNNTETTALHLHGCRLLCLPNFDRRHNRCAENRKSNLSTLLIHHPSKGSLPRRHLFSRPVDAIRGRGNLQKRQRKLSGMDLW
ncbi:hypothetical protein CDAR_428531 [Caerostris darwini]|uniref:Uncharacterized protein n=1 Tax=Caerostris darwini TaxID=1538125 RepID=A0AAV4STZ9_9ARAC|nr:hypothetical protein CDAR_428531 [Caerostris darwini]